MRVIREILVPLLRRSCVSSRVNGYEVVFDCLLDGQHGIRLCNLLTNQLAHMRIHRLERHGEGHWDVCLAKNCRRARNHGTEPVINLVSMGRESYLCYDGLEVLLLLVAFEVVAVFAHVLKVEETLLIGFPKRWNAVREEMSEFEIVCTKEVKRGCLLSMSSQIPTLMHIVGSHFFPGVYGVIKKLNGRY